MKVLRIIDGDEDIQQTVVIEMTEWETKHCCIFVSNGQIDSGLNSIFLNENEKHEALWLAEKALKSKEGGE